MPSLDIAVAVLYVVVVLMSLNFCTRRGILLVGAGCVALTIFSYMLSHDALKPDSALGRRLVSLLAIVITTLLAVRICPRATGCASMPTCSIYPEIEPYAGASAGRSRPGNSCGRRNSLSDLRIRSGARVPTLASALQRIHPEDVAMVEERLGAVSRP